MDRPAIPTASTLILPARFGAWFAARGWAPRPHQLALLEKVGAGRSVLLIAPTGAGKTLAGFLPSLVALETRGRPKPGRRQPGIHTLYISPLKALATDIARNIEAPVTEMALPVSLETRTGDTSQHKRRRQKLSPPDILMTTPEQLALLLAANDAERFFADLRHVVFDELHALVTSKRGDLLSLGLARLRALAPDIVTIGLSATVAEPDQLRGWLVPQTGEIDEAGRPLDLADLVVVEGGAKPDITILESEERVPWAGHSTVYAIGEIYAEIGRRKMTLVFVNTRSQAERIFGELWRINDDNLPIALHHGSLDVGQRRRVEAAMAAGELRAVVCTSTLDLGIDWGDIDLVMNVGAPKGASRLAQRIGRANHRMDEPSRAILVPANRFEVLECRAALDANYLGHQDSPPIRPGALDVLAQHTLGRACAGPFSADGFYAEVCSAYPYRALQREAFNRVLDFVATGGYALRAYERYAKIKLNKEGLWRLAHPRFAQQYRLNVGTIIEAPSMKVRLAGRRSGKGPVRGGRILGEVEEYFAEHLSQGDTFLFAGEVLRFEGIAENEVLVTRAHDEAPKVPSYAGGKFPLSTFLADGVRAMLADPEKRRNLPDQVRSWLDLQGEISYLPRRDELLVETFPRGNRFHMVAYPFEGRLAHQTLGMLLTRRLERMGAKPMGFVASDYAIAVWAMEDMGAMFDAGSPPVERLFDADMLGDDLEAWLAETYLLKRTFRACAIIAGLVERRHPGEEKTGRQMTVSTDLIYDVLRSHEPDHILMRATWADAATGLLDIARLSEMLSRVGERIMHKRLEHISPLAVPIMLDIGKERVAGGTDMLIAESADDLVREAMGENYEP
jgi:ATP-dependent Lhr-like helicase